MMKATGNFDHAAFEFNASIDDLAIMSDEQLMERTRKLNDILNGLRKNGQDTKRVEVELSWYLREEQIREYRQHKAAAYNKVHGNNNNAEA